MKTYKITVNGMAYDVTVEERDGAAAPVTTAPVKAAPAPRPAPAVPSPAPAAPKPAAPSGSQGAKKLKAPMPGKILAVKASVGQAIKKGDVVLILEAMKMENEIVASEDGSVASVNVGAGDMVEAGDVLATLN